MINEPLLKIYRGDSLERIIQTVEIFDESRQHVYNFCKYNKAIDAKTEEDVVVSYIPAAFKLEMPDMQKSQNLDFQCTFPMISHSHLVELESVLKSNENVYFKMRLYVENAFDKPGTQRPFTFLATDISYEKGSLTFSGKMLLNIFKEIPNKLYTSTTKYGLKYV